MVVAVHHEWRDRNDDAHSRSERPRGRPRQEQAHCSLSSRWRTSTMDNCDPDGNLVRCMPDCLAARLSGLRFARRCRDDHRHPSVVVARVRSRQAHVVVVDSVDGNYMDDPPVKRLQRFCSVSTKYKNGIRKCKATTKASTRLGFSARVQGELVFDHAHSCCSDPTDAFFHNDSLTENSVTQEHSHRLTWSVIWV